MFDLLLQAICSLLALRSMIRDITFNINDIPRHLTKKKFFFIEMTSYIMLMLMTWP